MPKQKVNIGIVGATGLVGQTFLKVMEEIDFPVANLYLFASASSAGKEVSFRNKLYVVEELTADVFEREMDIALFSAGGEISKIFAPLARDRGVIVIDNSSAWRMDDSVPLIVPEVNPEALLQHKGIIANPNCSTIQVMLPLKVLDQHFGIKRVVYSTYQAVSGSGKEGIDDLEQGLSGGNNRLYPHQIAGNCLPHIDDFLENGYTKEEMKMIEESRKILGREDLKVTATTVRVPVYYGHSIAVNVELEHEFELEKVRELFRDFEGLILRDDISNNIYPLASECAGKNEVFVGRIRRDDSVKYGLNMWVVADNIRKGAATNTVQIAELLVSEKDRLANSE